VESKREHDNSTYDAEHQHAYGFTLRTPVYSWKQALKLRGGDDSIDIRLIGRAAERIRKETPRKKRRKPRRISDLRGVCEFLNFDSET
jgi:hypothetical protein